MFNSTERKMKAKAAETMDLMIRQGVMVGDGRGRFKFSDSAAKRMEQRKSPEFKASTFGWTEDERFYRVFPELLVDAPLLSNAYLKNGPKMFKVKAVEKIGNDERYHIDSFKAVLVFEEGGLALTLLHDEVEALAEHWGWDAPAWVGQHIEVKAGSFAMLKSGVPS